MRRSISASSGGDTARRPTSLLASSIGPRRQKKAASQWVEIPLEQYITLPADTIIRMLLQRLANENDKIRFIDFCRRLEALYGARQQNAFKTMRRSFDLFMEHSHKCPYTLTHSVDFEEDTFVENFHRTMVKANYVLLTEQEYTDALATDFVLNLDLEMDEDELDSTMFRRFFDEHPDDPVLIQAAAVNRHVLVYHRGIGQATESGFFLMEKIDYVLAFLYHSVLLNIIFGFIALLQFWRWPAYISWAIRGDGFDDVHATSSAPPERSHCVERKSLASIISASWLGLFGSNTLCEPTFKELVIVYRTQKQLQAAPKGQPPCVTIKSFRSVPIADFEIVLPAQRPKTRHLDRVKLLVAFAVGVATIAVKVNQVLEARREARAGKAAEAAEGESFEEIVIESNEVFMDVCKDILPILIGIVSYAAKIIFQFNAQRARYMQMMTQYLYDKAGSTDHGVHTTLQDSTHQQEYKEALLAYYFLWQGTAKTMNELDDECEVFLESMGEKIDFEVDDALNKLLDDGLIAVDTGVLTPASTIRPLTCSRAITRLDQLWHNFFLNRNGPCPYCPLLEDEEDRLDHHTSEEASFARGFSAM